MHLTRNQSASLKLCEQLGVLLEVGHQLGEGHVARLRGAHHPFSRLHVRLLRRELALVRPRPLGDLLGEHHRGVRLHCSLK